MSPNTTGPFPMFLAEWLGWFMRNLNGRRSKGASGLTLRVVAFRTGKSDLDRQEGTTRAALTRRSADGRADCSRLHRPRRD